MAKETIGDLLERLEFIVRTRIVVSRKTGEGILKQIESAEPTPALRALLTDGDLDLPAK